MVSELPEPPPIGPALEALDKARKRRRDAKRERYVREHPDELVAAILEAIRKKGMKS